MEDLPDSPALPAVHAAHISEHDEVRLGVLGREGREALVLERGLRLLVEVGRVGDALRGGGLRHAVRVLELRDAVDPDLLRGGAEGKWVAVPEDDVRVVTWEVVREGWVSG